MVTDTTAPTEAQDNDAQETTPDTIDQIKLVDNGDDFDLRITEIKKGRGKGRLALFLEPTPTFPEFFAKLRDAVGPENWDKVVYAEVVRKACNDSTLQAIQENGGQKPTDVGFAKAFLEWFIPSTRRSGVHIKDLRDKAQELFSELNPLLLRHFQHKPGEDGALTDEEHNRMLQLTLEYSDLNTKIEQKSRKGKTAVAAK